MITFSKCWNFFGSKPYIPPKLWRSYNNIIVIKSLNLPPQLKDLPTNQNIWEKNSIETLLVCYRLIHRNLLHVAQYNLHRASRDAWSVIAISTHHWYEILTCWLTSLLKMKPREQSCHSPHTLIFEVKGRRNKNGRTDCLLIHNNISLLLQPRTDRPKDSFMNSLQEMSCCEAAFVFFFSFYPLTVLSVSLTATWV